MLLGRGLVVVLVLVLASQALSSWRLLRRRLLKRLPRLRLLRRAHELAGDRVGRERLGKARRAGGASGLPTH